MNRTHPLFFGLLLASNGPQQLGHSLSYFCVVQTNSTQYCYIPELGEKERDKMRARES